MLSLLCTVWLITTPCSDDVIMWDESLYATEVCTDVCIIYPVDAVEAPLGCWEGIVQLRHIDATGFSNWVSFDWELNPGRRMEWSIPGITPEECHG